MRTHRPFLYFSSSRRRQISLTKRCATSLSLFTFSLSGSLVVLFSARGRSSSLLTRGDPSQTLTSSQTQPSMMDLAPFFFFSSSSSSSSSFLPSRAFAHYNSSSSRNIRTRFICDTESIESMNLSLSLFLSFVRSFVVDYDVLFFLLCFSP